MKRYRVLVFDWDSTAAILGLQVSDEWEPEVQRQHHENKAKIRTWFLAQFGTADGDRKLHDFLDLGPLPLSVVAFHNTFHRQARSAFVAGAYFPALTGTCALAERVLNHLVLGLRESYRGTPEYKKVCRKDAFDNWDVALDTLEAWEVLLPTVTQEYRSLKELRHRSIHFRPETDTDDRALALAALRQFSNIVRDQFGAFGPQPWFIPGIRGASFIKKEWEGRPFIRLVYLPSSALVSPYHRLALNGTAWSVHEDRPYPDIDISDDEFARLLASASTAPPA